MGVETTFSGEFPEARSGAESAKPSVARGLGRLDNPISGFEAIVLAGQKIPDHKPPKFLMDKQIKHLVSGSSF
jgi:hypothetical protein